MKDSCSNQARLVGCRLLLTLACISAPPIKADGATLCDSGERDYNGFSMHPNAGHGGNLPLIAWSKCNVDKIWVAYDHPTATGQFPGYIDDIKITNNSIP
jgi:hypothetical protein